MQKTSKNKWSFKDKLEIVESIFTIIVSVMAIWGTVVAWKNGFWHKLERVTNHLHQELVSGKDAHALEVTIHHFEKEIPKKF